MWPIYEKPKGLKNSCKQEIRVVFNRSDLDVACFQNDMAYGNYKDSAKRTESDKALRDKAFKIASNPRYDVYERGLASMAYKFFDKKSAGTGVKSIPN